MRRLFSRTFVPVVVVGKISFYRWCSSDNSKSNSSNSSSTAATNADATKSTTAVSSSGGNESVEKTKESPKDVMRVKRLPLVLIEEVPKPERILSDIELIMMAWCEEHAKRLFVIMAFVRVCCIIGITIMFIAFYKACVGAEDMVRGSENIPQGMRIGSVVYLDFAENGLDAGRVVIGLLNEKCPLYCEFFHRKLTGNGGKGPSFKGQNLKSLIPNMAVIFGEGKDAKHEVEGFAPTYLPSEYCPGGFFRGSCMPIAYDIDKESPNFAITLCGGDTSPQIFGLVVGGQDVLERMSNRGISLGHKPRRNYEIVDCGELCTLDKSQIVPMPWRLYENVSKGYDEEKYGPRADTSVLKPPVLRRRNLEEREAPVMMAA